MLVTGGTRFGDETQPVHPCLMVTPPELGSPYPVMETSFLPDLFFFLAACASSRNRPQGHGSNSAGP